MPRCLQTTAMASRRGSFPETIACRMSSRRRLVDFPGIGNDPIQGLLFAREAIDATLVTVMITDEDVPARSLLVGEGQHDRDFLRCGACHVPIMRGIGCAFQPGCCSITQTTPVCWLA